MLQIGARISDIYTQSHNRLLVDFLPGLTLNLRCFILKAKRTKKVKEKFKIMEKNRRCNTNEIDHSLSVYSSKEMPEH